MVDRLLELPAAVRMVLFGIIAAAVMFLGYLTMSPETEDPAPDGATVTAPTPDDGSTVVPQNPDPGSAPDDESVEDYTEGVELRLEMPVEADELKTAAGRAARFSELFLSYRYDQNVKDKTSELNRLMAQENTIDLNSVFPTGIIADEFKAEQMVVGIDVTAIEVAMISENMLSLNATVVSTTKTVSDAPEESENAYAITMTYDPGRAAWYVSEFMTDGGPFQDELPG